MDSAKHLSHSFMEYFDDIYYRLTYKQKDLSRSEITVTKENASISV